MAKDWFTLFWVEWVSLAIVATHYILDTIPLEYVRYTALTEDDTAVALPLIATKRAER